MNYYNEFDPHAAAWLRALIADGLIPQGEVDERSIVEVQPADLRGFTQHHFFAGIGGWPLALQLAGWPATRPVWTGSCPCQPFSAAGKRKGSKDDRDIWHEFHRLIEACKPEKVFGEQVASSEVVGTQLEADFVVAVQRGDFARANKLAKRLVKSNSFHFWPRWVDRIQADLARTDYTFGFKVLGAHSVGAPHIRQRLFWVADGAGARLQGWQDARTGCGDAGANGRGCVKPERGVLAGLLDTDGAGPQPGRQAATPARYRATPDAAGGDGGLQHPSRNGWDERRSGADGREFASGCGAGGVCHPIDQGLEGHAGDGEDGREPGRLDTNAERPTAAPGFRSVGGIPVPTGCERSARGLRTGETPARRFAAVDSEQRSGADAYQGNEACIPATGFWGDFDIIPFRDGKARRIESGLEPLAHGVSGRVAIRARQGFGEEIEAWYNRVVALKGFGNAIVPQVAAEFIGAFADSIAA